LFLLAALPSALAPLVGFWIVWASAAALVLVVVYLATPQSSGRPWRLAARALALAGGLIGVGAAFDALTTVGTDPAYAARDWLGWSAATLAVLAGAGGVVAQRQPGLGALVALGAGLLGAAALSLFYINTVYMFALPFWLLAAVCAVAQPVGKTRVRF
jgi:hypothetical protein